MNLDDYEALAKAQGEGLVIELADPLTGEPTGATITMAGPDTKAARIAQMKAVRHVLAKADKAELSEDDEQEIKLRTAAGAVLSWDGIRKGDTDLPCTFENALMLFSRFPWWLTQCDRKASDRRNFIKG